MPRRVEMAFPRCSAISDFGTVKMVTGPLASRLEEPARLEEPFVEGFMASL